MDATKEIGGLLDGVDDNTINHNEDVPIFRETDLSPKIIKSLKHAKKGKKPINKENNLPSRSQPRRGCASQYSKK